jgi:macrolide-specific efflux system membrane fusion protein
VKIKKVLLFLVIITAITGSIYYFKKEHNKNSAVAEQIATPTRGTIEQVVTSQGKLEPKEYVDVGAQVSGQLKKLYVDIGNNVKNGDVIADIDDKIYQSKVEADQAGLKTLQAQLNEQLAQIVYSQEQYDRNQRLMKSKAVSQQVLEDSQTTLKVAKARADSYKAQIEQANSSLKADIANLGYTKIYAPMDGTIVSQTAREGQTLNANQSAPVIVQVANLDTMTVRAQVAEADVLSLKPDMPVYFTVLGNQKRKWQGKVRQILPTPEVINDVVLYDVLVDADNTDHQLMTGMTTQMSFVMGHADNALLIPVEALIKPLPDKNDATGDAYLVHVKEGDIKTNKVIHIGLTTRTQAEVTSGLNETDQLIVKSVSTAKPAAAGAKRPSLGPRI